MEQKEHCLNLKSSSRRKQNSCTSAVTMAAIISESEIWLQLAWVNEKLAQRWEQVGNIDFELFKI
jgi:hypothetical protein